MRIYCPECNYLLTTDNDRCPACGFDPTREVQFDDDEEYEYDG